MLEIALGLLVVIDAVVVVCRLAGIRRGRWRAMLATVLVARHDGRRRSPPRLPHPIRATRGMAKRTVRYMSVSRNWIYRGLVHSDHDGGAPGSRLGRSLRRLFEDASGLFINPEQAMAQQPQLVAVPVAAELALLQEGAAPADLDAARAVIAADLGAPEEVFVERYSQRSCSPPDRRQRCEAFAS